MPDFASRKDATTSLALLPMDETMPIPVTTTRLMVFLSWKSSNERLRGCPLGRRRSRRRLQGRHGVAEQADLHVLHFERDDAVDLYDSVGDAKHEFAHDHALELDVVGDLLGGGQDHAAELHFADAERTAPAQTAGPTEEEAHHLPQRIEAETAGHHRIVLEVAF